MMLRSLSRKDHLEQLLQFAGVTPNSTRANDMFRQAFETPAINSETIERFIRQVYGNERKFRRSLEPKLVSELYKIQVFEWGGLYQNSLERTIVDQYVKKIRDYDFFG